MAKGINKVILVGNLGTDPEVKYMPSGGAVTNFSLATTDSWKDKTSGERVDKTEWHRVVFFNRLAEIAGEYLKKGSQVYIEGSLRTRKWQDQGGQDRYTTEIVGSEMQMLGSRSGGNSEFDQSQSRPAPQKNRPQQSAPQNQSRQAPPPAQNFDDFDDDIPF